MSVTTTDPENLRRYLLGQQPEAEAERMEALLLEDDELSTLAESVEEELLVEHFRGELPEGRDLVDRLSASAAGRRRIELARAVAAAMPAKGRPPARSLWRTFVPAAAAAALVGVVVGLGHLHGPIPPPPIPPPPIPPPYTQPGDEPPPVVLNLPLITLRGEEETLPSLVLGKATTRAELRLRLQSGEAYPDYRVSISREGGGTVPHGLKVLPGFLVVLLRAADLPTGVYEVAARGVPNQGEPELLGDVRFNVVRSPT